jgi:hypothetical protein
MNIKLFALLPVFVLLLLPPPASAQDVEVGLLAGGTYYLGELNPGRQFLLTNPAYGGIIKFNFNDRWAARFNIMRGQLSGDDAISKVNELRNLRFRSPLTEVSMVLEFNFLDYFTGSNIKYFSPYLFGGPGFFIFEPRADYQGETLSLRDLGTEGQIDAENQYSLYGVAAVFGFGIKYSISNRIGLGLEWGMRKTFTDYLDDISGRYYIDFSDFDNVAQIGIAEILSDPSPVKHEPGMYRGNPTNNDWYSFAGITLTYRFRLGETSTCSEFDNSRN